jgi:hypothetical protein
MFNIITIDGPVGVGKSLQVGMLCLKFKELKIETRIVSFNIEDNDENCEDKLKNIENLIKLNPKLVVICDGSIISGVISSLMSGLNHQTVLRNHSKSFRSYENISRNYKVKNILLIPKDLSVCVERINCQKAVERKSTDLTVDNLAKISTSIMGFKGMDSSLLAYNITYDKINTYKGESILETHEKIKEIIFEK